MATQLPKASETSGGPGPGLEAEASARGSVFAVLSRLDLLMHFSEAASITRLGQVRPGRTLSREIAVRASLQPEFAGDVGAEDMRPLFPECSGSSKGR